MSSSLRSSPKATTQPTGPLACSIEASRRLTARPLLTPRGLISTVVELFTTSIGLPMSSSKCSVNSFACQLPKSGSASLKCHAAADSFTWTELPSVLSWYDCIIGTATSCHELTISTLRCQRLEFAGFMNCPCSAASASRSSWNHSSKIPRSRPLTMHTVTSAVAVSARSAFITSAGGGMSMLHPRCDVSVPS